MSVEKFREPSDTELLNWLESLATEDGYQGWKLRRSSTGRGWRLLTTREPPNYRTPREALIVAFNECGKELAALDQLLGDAE